MYGQYSTCVLEVLTCIKVFIALHLVVHIKSNKSSCVKNVVFYTHAHLANHCVEWL